MKKPPEPTERELEILKILWDEGEASVRTVYEQMSQHSPIVQNTVQAFLRTMESKNLVRHRIEGRSFIYSPTMKRDQANKKMMSRILQRVFDGAIDQLVQSAFAARKPTEEEIKQLELLIKDARKNNS